MRKLNFKGQALLEFVLIVPVMLMIIFSSYDFLKIIYAKTKLENLTNDCINYMKKDSSFEFVNNMIKKQDNDVKLEVSYQEDDYMNIRLSKNITILTPGLNIVLDNPYKIKVERVIEYEKK